MAWLAQALDYDEYFLYSHQYNNIHNNFNNNKVENKRKELERQELEKKEIEAMRRAREIKANPIRHFKWDGSRDGCLMKRKEQEGSTAMWNT